jgi:hypothetical protein
MDCRDRSLGLDVCRLDDGPPLVDFVLEVDAQSRRRLLLARRDLDAKTGSPSSTSPSWRRWRIRHFATA